MKKLIAILICLSTLIMTVGCKNEKYPKIESTKEEARVMMSFSIDGEKYELKYELYRAFFLDLSSKYDGGDKSFWAKPEASDELALVNAQILDNALNIFATLHVALKTGFDPYSNTVDNMVAEYIKLSVEGDGESVIGFGGDYDAYLASLKAANINYSVQDLLLRYSIANDHIISHYGGSSNENNPSEDKDGAIAPKREDVLSFYNSTDSVRVSKTVVSGSKSIAIAQEIRNALASSQSIYDMLDTVMSTTITLESEFVDGVLIGTHSLQDAYNNDNAIIEAAFALSTNETSSVIKVNTDMGLEYWILHKLPKDESFFNDHYTDIEDVYVSHKIGEILNNAKVTLRNSLTESEAYKNLNHSEISMK